MNLRLAITQGPQQGQTLDFAPGSTVRIGRIVRGNTIPIKDSGVSSKHLLIESGHGNWILRDLDSSNGTFLNGSAVDPGVSVELSDGDCVKIGESTSISVSIGENEDRGRRRRNHRRGESEAENRRKDEVLGVEDVEVSARPVETRQRSRRLKKDDVSVSGLVLEKIPEDSEVDLGEVKPVRAKLTRARMQRGKKRQQESVDEDSEAGVLVDVADERIEKDNDLESDLVEMKPFQTKLPRSRMQRGKMKQQESVDEDFKAGVRVDERIEKDNDCGVAKSSDGVGIAGGLGSNEVDVVEVKAALDKPTRPRMQKGKKKRQESVDKNSKAGVRVDIAEERIEKGNDCTVVESTDGVGIAGGLGSNEVGVAEVKEGLDKPTCPRMQRGKKLQREPVRVDSEAGVQANVFEDRIEDENGCEVAESFDGVGRAGGVDLKEVDSEKMTLGEWFDLLEVDFPKQIIEATEEIIKGVRLKAKRVHEYVAQQKKGKEIVV